MLLKAVASVVQMCKMPVHMLKHMESRPVCKQMMHTLNWPGKFWEKRSNEDQ